jgi:hypothetical protein
MGLRSDLFNGRFGSRFSGRISRGLGSRGRGRSGLSQRGGQLPALQDALADRHPLQDSLFDLGQPVVVFVKDPSRLADVHPLLAGVLPGQVDQPFHIGAHNAHLRRGTRQRLQPVQLLEGAGVDCLRHPSGIDPLPQVVLGGGLSAHLGQLLADGLELLAEDRFALALVDGLGNVLLDLVAQLGHLQLAG